MASSFFHALLLFFLFSNVLPLSDSASGGQVLLEEGYTVTTVIDGHKVGVNPHSVLPMYGSSDLVVLDAANSGFYTMSLPVSQGSVVKHLAGDKVGYSDGDLSSAQFNRPRSFAIDLRGNVYVADKNNNVIRKITNSGVKTIAGGYQKTGRQDGPAQNASFSSDFELTFIPQSCSLLISDHGNQLVRQIVLKEDDCRKDSPSVMGAAWIWALGLGLSSFLGLIVGLVVRPYISFLSHEGSSHHSSRETWKHCLINLEKKAQIHCLGARNAIAKSDLCRLLSRLFLLGISHLSLMFRMYSVEKQAVREETSSSLVSDESNSAGIAKPLGSHQSNDQFKELISFEEHLDLTSAAAELLSLVPEDQRNDSVDSTGKLDEMIQANVMAFAGSGKGAMVSNISSVSISGLVRRK